MAEGRSAEALNLLRNPAPNEWGDLELRRELDVANASAKLGRADAALSSLKRLKTTAEHSKSVLLLAQIETLLGALLARSGNSEDAEATLQSAVAHASASRAPYFEASAYINLSFTDLNRARFDDAIDYGQRAVKLAEPIQARRIIGAAYSNIATAYAWLGNFDQAIAVQQKALELHKAAGDEPNMQVSLGQIGNLHMLQQEPDLSVSSYEQAFQIATKDRLLSDASKWAGNLSDAFSDLQLWDKAEEWNNKARDLKLQISDLHLLPLLMMNAARIAEGRGKVSEAEQLYREVINKGAKEPGLAWEARAGLGQLYAEQKRFADANREFEGALSAIETTRADVRDPSSRISFLSHLVRFEQDYVDVLVEQGAGQRALKVAESSRARVLAERLGSSPSEQALARIPNAVLLSYWIAPRRSFLWVVNAAGTRRFDLPPAAVIEKLVAAHRRTIEDDLREPTSTELGDALLKPAQPLIPPHSRVIVVPDGPLHRVNLETLLVSSPQPHYWIEDVVLSVAPSLVLLQAATNPQSNPKSLLAIGAPAEADPSFRPPTYAGRELENIGKYFTAGESRVITGPAATPDAYKLSDPQRFSLIHFAAHADANRVSPLDSAVILARGHEGFRLYARDVANVPLHASLVTVSSCRSAGVKAYNGEGLIGFAWAFLGAGARSVIAGLWDVNDTSTATLMDSFYGEIAQGRDTATALHDAKLRLIASGGNMRKPYYWGPFQLYTRTLPAPGANPSAPVTLRPTLQAAR